MIIRGTTPTLSFHVKNEDLNLNEIAEIWITFKTKIGLKPQEKSFGMDNIFIDAENHTIELYLGQEDTLFFMGNQVFAQIRARLDNDLAYASSIFEIDIGQILKDGVI